MHDSFDTPMMRQYIDIKNMYPDCLLLFRLGDFYEMFMEDAKIGAKVLDITLTSRDRGKDGRIPMSGIPYHALDSYLFKLVKAGYKVAICEQMTEPGKGLVEREVVRIVTPGTVLDEHSLDKKENNYIFGVHLSDAKFGIAVADLSTGSFQAAEFPREMLEHVLVNELTKFHPTECVLPQDVYALPNVLRSLKVHKGLNIFPYNDWPLDIGIAVRSLKDHFGVNALEAFGIENMYHAQQASAGLLSYLKYTQKDKLAHIRNISLLVNTGTLLLDRSTINNLELLIGLRDGSKKDTFLNYIDRTITPMGGRLLKSWLLRPLADAVKINDRYDAVAELLANDDSRNGIASCANEIWDVERILSRLSVGIGNPKDLVNLKNSLKYIKSLKDILLPLHAPLFKSIYHSISDEALNLYAYLNDLVVEDPPFDPRDGGILRQGVNNELDELRDKVSSSKQYISQLETRERDRTGISSLKVKFNQVFGYYIEVTRSNLDSIPADYYRKQTLVNAERFITPELKEHEEIILTADQKIKEIEYKGFCDIVDHILFLTPAIQEAAYAVAETDCLLNFANISRDGNFCRPSLTTDGGIDIYAGRHPVVENTLEAGLFIPNDTHLSNGENQLLLITGPNMAGKSVYIRQVALIVLLAQMGCFVPAKEATISVVDKIFVRSGASDMISSGLSTFMVEMVETANILNNATSKSLIVMDEIGRGTSTFDGISIAWAVAEHLVKDPSFRPKTLFATHYHELQALAEKYPGSIKNYQVAVDESSGDPVFLHKVIPGAADHSYGIAVARLAGVPLSVCSSASQLLAELEGEKHLKGSITPKATELVEIDPNNLLLDKLQQIDISSTTPLEALNLLAELKRVLNV